MNSVQCMCIYSSLYNTIIMWEYAYAIIVRNKTKQRKIINVFFFFISRGQIRASR